MNTKMNFSGHFLRNSVLILIFLGFISCGDKISLSENTALSTVETYLKANPVYETADFEIGEISFKGKKDADKLQAYKGLADKGYIKFELAKQKKKFLSKDSTFVYEVGLTDKSRPFVFKQKKNKAEVKTFEYRLDEKESPKVEMSGKKSANVTVHLKKTSTDFSVLTTDKNPHSSFITKTFKLRYDKEGGWTVAR